MWIRIGRCGLHGSAWIDWIATLLGWALGVRIGVGVGGVGSRCIGRITCYQIGVGRAPRGWIGIGWLAWMGDRGVELQWGEASLIAPEFQSQGSLVGCSCFAAWGEHWRQGGGVQHR